GGQIVFTLREDWTPPFLTNASEPGPLLGTKLNKGSLVSYPFENYFNSDKPVQYRVLYSPGPRSSVDEVATGRDAVYASIYDNVVGSIHAFRFNMAKGAWSDSTLDLPGHGSTHIVSTNDYGPEAEFRFENFVTPTTLYADSGDDKTVAIKSLPARFDASNLTTEQFEATSKDGMKIPYFVTRAKNIAGPAPTVLYGYGGFEVSETPVYSTNFGLLWLAKGGVYVLANIRGGGEFGPAWHQAALRENRQKAYDDFQAVAADLTVRGITTPKQLGIMGGSNGGLLVSANMVERPDLFGAVVCQVPLIDMIRYTEIGAGASWIAEYGDPADPKAREWILKYSPYQNVKPDVKYPPVLFVTATSDDRVTPVHARKMAARMLAQGHDVMFYENTDGGHAAAADHKQAAEMWALSFVYLREKLGLGR
ncbi:MAG: prolyl oligopeptidase family serine peptidase, partial [Rhizomicrobium sp.]